MSQRYLQYRTPIFFFGFIVVLIAFVFLLRIVIGPFILALVLAYILNPFIEVLEKKGYRRSAIVTGVLLSATVLLFMLVWVVAPMLFQQLETLVKTLPRFRDYVETNWLPHLDKLVGEITGKHSERVGKLADMLPSIFEKPSETLLQNFGQSTRFVASWLITSVISPVFAFFVMRDFRNLMYKIMNLVPPDMRSTFIRYLKDVDHTLRAVLRGQLLVVSLLGFLYSTAFVTVGMPAGLAVGLFTGLARLVPYLDIIVGGTLSFLILATSNVPDTVVIGVIVSFLSIQLLDALILTPRIMGQFSGLHPFLIILSVLCFGDWFGFFGVLLAIPLAALGRVTLLTLVRLYKRSRFFTNRDDEVLMAPQKISEVE